MNRDNIIFDLWMAGVGAEAIGGALGVTWGRAIHEINRVLNQRAGLSRARVQPDLFGER